MRCWLGQAMLKLESASQVRIPAHNLQATFAEVKGRHVWGTDVYTDDSDIVCAVMHCGYFNASLKKPVASVAEMKVVIQILPPQIEYPVFVRNGIRSRAWWAGGTTCSYKVCILSTLRPCFVLGRISRVACFGGPTAWLLFIWVVAP